MSTNRENVIWKSRDGTWNRGFYDFYQTGEDYEWDVEYDHSSFMWASTGHATKEQANAAWTGSNPGGCWNFDTPNEETDRLDAMAAAYLEEERKLKAEIASRPRSTLYSWR